MSSFDITADLFHRHIEQISLAADSVADLGELAVPVIASAMMTDRKVYSIGTGIDANLANTFCHLIRDGLGAERPNLPIIPLTSVAAEPIDAATHWLAREIRTLGHAGDVAVVWGSQLSSSGVDLLSSGLSQREMTAFWIGAPGQNHNFLPFADADPGVRYGLCVMAAVAMTQLVESALFDHQD